MTYTIPLEKCKSVMGNVARALRKKYSVDDNTLIWPWITKEYGVTVNYSNILRKNSPPTTVTFSSEAQYTMLMLKYHERT